jgi:hypothetical protein
MAVHRVDSQVTIILNHLKTFKEINPLEAFSKYGVYRLGAVIFILKDDGYTISTRMHHYTKPSGKRGKYAIYRLEEENA